MTDMNADEIKARAIAISLVSLAKIGVGGELEVEPAIFEEARELFGVVVAVDAGTRKGASVKIRLDDGAAQDFDADIGIAQRAARLFMRTVRVLATYTVTNDSTAEGRIEELDTWEGADDFRDEPLVAFDAVRALAKQEKISAADWLEELFDEDQ